MSQEKEFDINLCYKALGSSVSDSPAQLEEKYQKLIRRCKTELKSENPNVREEARSQIAFFEDMYQQIRESVSYSSVEREEKKRNPAGPQAQTRQIRGYLIHCPTCHAMISKGLKSCPVCKADFRSASERWADKYLTKGTVAAGVLLLLVAALAAFALANPEEIEQLKRLVAK